MIDAVAKSDCLLYAGHLVHASMMEASGDRISPAGIPPVSGGRTTFSVPRAERGGFRARRCRRSRAFASFAKPPAPRTPSSKRWPRDSRRQPSRPPSPNCWTFAPLATSTSRIRKGRKFLPMMPFPLTTMVLNVTNQCNLACTYCYEYGEDKIVDTEHGKQSKFMSEETARQSVEFLLKESRPRRAHDVLRRRDPAELPGPEVDGRLRAPAGGRGRQGRSTSASRPTPRSCSPTSSISWPTTTSA